MNSSETIFEKTIGRARPWWATLLIGLFLFVLAFAVGIFEHGLPNLFTEGYWRGLFINPSIIFYIMLIAPKLTQMENEVIEAIIPLGGLTEETLQQVFEDTQAERPFREWVSVGVGVLVIILTMVFGGGIEFGLTGIFVLLVSAAAFGILSWTVYASVVSVRVTARLLKQPLQVNLFDLDAFKVVGRSSLYLALAFIGGFTLALFFTAPDFSVLQNVEFWLINLPMFLIPVIIFFWNMYPTHKIIDSAKRAALKQAGQMIRVVSARLMAGIDHTSGAGELSQSLQGLIAYEQRLEKVQTWPYEVSTLRSLFGSILIPVITVVGQVALRRLLGW